MWFHYAERELCFFFVALLAACHYTERERKEFFVVVGGAPYGVPLH
jgi:hypothetical protein